MADEAILASYPTAGSARSAALEIRASGAACSSQTLRPDLAAASAGKDIARTRVSPWLKKQPPSGHETKYAFFERSTGCQSNTTADAQAIMRLDCIKPANCLDLLRKTTPN